MSKRKKDHKNHEEHQKDSKVDEGIVNNVSEEMESLKKQLEEERNSFLIKVA